MDNQDTASAGQAAPVTAGVDISRIAIPASITNVKLEPVKFNFRKDKELGTTLVASSLAMPVTTRVSAISAWNISFVFMIVTPINFIFIIDLF